MIDTFRKDLSRLLSLLEQEAKELPASIKPAKTGHLSPATPTPSPSSPKGLPRHASAILDFETSKNKARASLLSHQFDAVRDGAARLSGISHASGNAKPVREAQSLALDLDPSDPIESAAAVRRMLALCDRMIDAAPGLSTIKSIKVPLVPDDIRSDVTADIKEIERCMESGCFRSATILCGRILETALHRKYFDVTGQDVLEKNPGIGLGNLIAKLVEKNVAFDPGLTQQIHLINQVRVFSVHKKQEAFSPSQGQAQAIVLYTIDAVEKLFPRRTV